MVASVFGVGLGLLDSVSCELGLSLAAESSTLRMRDIYAILTDPFC